MKIDVLPPTMVKITCLDTDCLYTKNCANHVSADFGRNQYGFRPQLSKLKCGGVFCDTKQKKVQHTDAFEGLPENYIKLDHGAVLWHDLKNLVMDDWNTV